MDERRKYIRVKTNLVTWVEGSSEDYERDMIFGSFTMGNISGGGIKLEINKQLKKGTILKLKFNLPKSHEIQAKGKIAWCKERKNKNYDVGIEFTAIDEDAQQYIIDFCQGKTKKKKWWKIF